MNSIANSFRREVRRLAADPWDLAMVTWVPLLGVALLWWIFSAGLPRHLAVGVVDDDHSSLSRQLVRMLDATPEPRDRLLPLALLLARKAVEKEPENVDFQTILAQARKWQDKLTQ